MAACQVCLVSRQHLRFDTPRLKICDQCVERLNAWREPAQAAYDDLEDGLRRGLRKRLGTRASAEEIESECREGARRWITSVCANKNRTTKSDCTVRAHRKGLVLRHRPKNWGYPAKWSALAARVRQLDGHCCVRCKTDSEELHVHHVIYVSNLGTHQLHNLVTLCRSCHEEEHERTFDRGEDLEEPDQKPRSGANIDDFSDLLAMLDGPRPPSPRERLLEDCAYILSRMAEDLPGEAKEGFAVLVSRLEVDLELPEMLRGQLVNAATTAWVDFRGSRRRTCASQVWGMFRAVLELDSTHLRASARAPALPLSQKLDPSSQQGA